MSIRRNPGWLDKMDNMRRAKLTSCKRNRNKVISKFWARIYVPSESPNFPVTTDSSSELVKIRLRFQKHLNMLTDRWTDDDDHGHDWQAIRTIYLYSSARVSETHTASNRTGIQQFLQDYMCAQRKLSSV